MKRTRILVIPIMTLFLCFLLNGFGSLGDSGGKKLGESRRHLDSPITSPRDHESNSSRASSIEDSMQNAELVQSSRRAIIGTGLSEKYFDEHFHVVEVVNKTADTRVVWKLSLNGYETLVNDLIGYYTGERQKRVYVHSVGNTLGSTRDITRTIPRRKAEALMKSCLGTYASEAVVLMRLSPGEKASLYFTAYSTSGATKGQVQAPERNKRINKRNPEVDEPKAGETEKHPPISIGYVNLETGKCSKGQAIVAP